MALMNLRNALMAGKRTPTAKDYPFMPDVFYYDAIENAGYSQHNTPLARWKDLVGSVDIALTNVTVGNDYMFFPKGTTAATKGYGTANFPNYGSIELVLSKSVSENTDNCCIISVGAQTYSGYGVCAPSGKVTDTYDAGAAPFVKVKDGELFSVVLNKNGAETTEMAKNGIIMSYGTMGSGSRYSAGSNGINGSSSGSIGRASNLWIRAIRGHSTTLTAQQIAANYAIDIARYGLPQRGTPMTWQDGLQYNNVGTPVESADSSIGLDYIPITAGHSFTWRLGYGSSASADLIIYNANKERIDYWEARDRTVTISGAAAHMRVSALYSYKEQATVFDETAQQFVFVGGIIPPSVS